jgi:hypothetical protein
LFFWLIEPPAGRSALGNVLVKLRSAPVRRIPVPHPDDRSSKISGHESPKTTHLYVEASLAMKKLALAKVNPPHVTGNRFRPNKDDLAILDDL